MRSLTRDARLAQLDQQFEVAEYEYTAAEAALAALRYDDPDYELFSDRFYDAKFTLACIEHQMHLLRRRHR